jgi:hypothetical protein
MCRPGDPIASKFEPRHHRRDTRMLGLVVPPMLLARADEMIE